MVYDVIIIDTANLYYRLKKNSKSSIDIIKKINNFIDGEVKSKLNPNGTLYFLFDPISYSDLDESKSFYYSLNERKQLLPDYKSGRTYSPLYLETIELLRKYYLYRGDKIKLVYSDQFEADDFVEPILDMHQHESVALISTDYDLASYISNNPIVHLINDSFNKPFTVEQFEKLFQFKPTIATNTMFKALFGDKSDNITGVLQIKKVKFSNNIKILCKEYLQELSAKNTTLNDAVEQFKTATFLKINDIKEKSAFDHLYLNLSIADLKVPVFSQLHTNIKIIRSALTGQDIEKFTHSNPINNSINDVIHKSIYGIPFSNSFGRVVNVK